MKKNPDNQKVLGAPCSIHSYMNFNLAIKSTTHDARGFKDGYAFFDQSAGTKLSNKLLPTYSNSKDMTTSPLIAFPRFINEPLTSLSSLLNLKSSC